MAYFEPAIIDRLQAVPQEIKIVLSLAILALLLFTIYAMFQDVRPSYDDSKEVFPRDKKR